MNQIPDNQSTDAVNPLRSVHTQSFTRILQQLGITVAITTYQAGKLVLARADGQLTNTHFRVFNKPMGMAVRPDRLALGVAGQIMEFRNCQAAAGKLEPANKHDACYLPRTSHVTGDVDVHEMIWVDNELWFINTKFSCLCTVERDYSFVPRWRPPFVSAYDLRDRCHLNGLCVRDGRPRYVTALGQSDTPAGWRQHKANGGVLIDLNDNKLLLQNLSMPHSPRWYQNRLWFLESGKGTLAYFDFNRNQVITVAQLPGFTRGLDFSGELAFIGLSQVRESAVFAGLPLTRTQPIRHCGVWVVNWQSGEIVAFLRFEEGVQEIFAVALMPWRFPDLLNDDNNLINTTYVLPDAALAQAVQPQTHWESAEQHFEAGNKQYQDKQVDAAMTSYRRALELQPDFLPARFNLGVVLGNIDRYAEAVVELQKVIAAEAGHADAYNSLGYLESLHGDRHKAIANFQQAITIAPQHAQAHHNLGLVLLKVGEFNAGFKELEWRWRTPGFTPFEVPHPRWDGSIQPQLRLLLHTEQGAGDTFQLARFVAWAAQRVGSIMLLAPPDLQPLLADLPGVVQIRGAGELARDSFDSWLPFMSLPLVYGLTPQNIPAPVPYLSVPNRPERQLPNDGRLRVGISWAGNPTQGLDRYRSSALRDWLPILSLPNIAFFSLQKGEVALTELAQLPDNVRPQDLSHNLHDWGDTAAYLAQLDLLIAVDTGIVHLAGALGRPVWTLVYQGADWRYPEVGEHSPWYPTMRLFHQQSRGDWRSVMTEVVAQLSSMQQKR